ncbi:hypothetical protein ERO13_D02G094200v2, partial [Gossypium hirsutum]
PKAKNSSFSLCELANPKGALYSRSDHGNRNFRDRPRRIHWLGIYLYLFLGVRDMNWVQRKIYLYNVTFGLYMLDWWERYLFNTLVIVLMWFIFYNSSRYVTEFYKRHLS